MNLRRGGLAIGTIFAAMLVTGACVTPTGPPPTTVPWLDAGCIDSSLPGVPDFEFSGYENQLNNAISFTLGGVVTDDGSCSGNEDSLGTIVRAADSAAAIDVCGDLGIPVTDPANLAAFGYAVPGDAWTCLDNP